MAAYTTKLLVLGAIGIFEPAHGYKLRQELLSWQIDRWAKVNPGSIYNALRTLHRNKLLEQIDTEDASKYPAKAVYRRTEAGRLECERLLRDAIVNAGIFDSATLMTALSFAQSLHRDELLELLRLRQHKLEHERDAARSSAKVTRAAAPPHVQELFNYSVSLITGDLKWTRSYLAKVEAGAYSYLGEDPDWTAPDDDPIWGSHQ